MRARVLVVVFAVALGPCVGVLPAAQALPGVLICAKLRGTFSDTPGPWNGYGVAYGVLAVQASGTCLLNGHQVAAAVQGSGRSVFGGICGAITFSTPDSELPDDIEPIESGSLDVTVTLTPTTGPATQLTETWDILATENVESVPFQVRGGRNGAGNIVTRIFARCGISVGGEPPGAAGTDGAVFTWRQSA